MSSLQEWVLDVPGCDPYRASHKAPPPTCGVAPINLTRLAAGERGGNGAPLCSRVDRRRSVTVGAREAVTSVAEEPLGASGSRSREPAEVVELEAEGDEVDYDTMKARGLVPLRSR